MICMRPLVNLIDYGIVPSEHFWHAADAIEAVVSYVSGKRILQS